MASLMAYSVAKGQWGAEIIPKVELVTIGGLRAGNKAFADTINKAGFKETARLVHSNDMVPHLPYSTSTATYAHWRGEVFMSPFKHQWVTCNDRDLSVTPSENCGFSFPSTNLSLIAHAAYWSRLDYYNCPVRDQNETLGNEYLPT